MAFDSLVFWSQGFILDFTYFAVFVVTALGSSTVFFPLPIGYGAILFAMAMGLNPFIVGVLAGLGSSVGELTSYVVGYYGMTALEKYERKTPRIVLKLMKFFKSFGFWVILIFAFLPSPFDFIGVTSGVVKYDIKKFLIALIVGRIARSMLVAYGSSFIVPYLLSLI